MRAVVASMRDIPARVIPYATATALTRVAKEAQREVERRMPEVFNEPTRFTLNALRTEPASKDRLVARVAVKDIAAGVPQEKYLEPQVVGGPRREKRFERALRYSGALAPGERATIGQAAPVDRHGNIAVGEIRRILGALGIETKAGKAGKETKGRRPGQAYFAGAVGRRGARGVWQRDGRRVRPVLIFTRQAPQYRKRLAFGEIARQVAEDRFADEFARAARAIMARRRSP